ncbi:hypothetical protein ACOI1H_23025 [Loktanella sp. DJP18]|uniref:hypothetical protein n=1 Tax=Loktanella sp. DJP18 TaxID=3409788 RepID=UPI003BB7D382
MTPKLAQAFKTFAETTTNYFEFILSGYVDEPLWGEPLRVWLGECARSPEAALRPDVAEAALRNLIALHLSRYAFSMAPDGMTIIDRGGALSAIQAQDGFLTLAARHDPGLAAHLAKLGQLHTEDTLRKMTSLIAKPRF